MNWIKTVDKEPEEGVSVLVTNHAYLDPANERYYVVAQRLDDEYFDPESMEAYFKPDYWCEIVAPAK